ncbi:MAG: DUF2971 domain-containing protein [Ekhidna sp.]
MNPITGKFYKYRPIGPSQSEFRKRISEIIIDNKIYFPCPIQLNDPTDCRPSTMIGDLEVLRAHLIESSREVRESLSIEASADEIAKMEANILAAQFDMARRNARLFDGINKHTGVFSTSTSPLLSTQWAYYGDSHKGVCLEFTIAGPSQFFVLPVIYTDDRVVVDISKYLTDNEYCNEISLKFISTKSLAWAHEKEARFMHMRNESCNYDPALLTAIIFGLDTPIEYKEFVLDLLKKSKANPQIRECITAHESFNLEIK